MPTALLTKEPATMTEVFEAKRQNVKNQNAQQQNSRQQGAKQQSPEQQNAGQQNAGQQNSRQQSTKSQSTRQQNTQQQSARQQSPTASLTPAAVPTVFSRQEEKYLIDFYTCDALIQSLGSALVADKRGSTLIRNLYLDMPDFQLIRRSIAKPRYKEKLRVRSYGNVASLEHPCFLEIKKKLDGQVYKRRAGMNLTEAICLVGTAANAAAKSQSSLDGQDATVAKSQARLDGRDKSAAARQSFSAAALLAKDALSAQIEREIEWALELYKPLQPAISVNYERCAYTYPGLSGSVRITVDCNVAYKPGSWQDFLLDPASPEFRPLLAEQTCIMEIKALDALPLELARTLSKLQIYPVSFSKVGTAYASHLRK